MADKTNSLNQRPAEQDLFTAALSRQSPDDRAAFLHGACGPDARLRTRVESLLQAAHAAGDFLENPPPGTTTDEPTASTTPSTFPEQTGDRIGRYKLLEVIGEGGCGTVYMAEQEYPVRRRVALKVIKLGMDTSAVVNRFEAERQALALMDHHGIAKVLDAGATPSGRPFFVMEWVQGIALNDYCTQNQLPVRERLELFMDVCQAVQHAHQKGIIHRDLKPANVLVSDTEGRPWPKVIDFGIAKATGGQLTDKTLFTQFFTLLGTPAYISPEQAEMSSVDIDTRSDIYSLGVLLYELLTGHTPFDGERLMQSGLDEMRRVIREEPPPRPSTRLSMLRYLNPGDSSPPRIGDAKDTSQEPFPLPGPSLKQLIFAVRGDLDWIVMKCLEKDRSRRYATVSGLAADIGRHLNHQPVTARPPSRFYQCHKMVRRNRTLCVAALIIVLTLFTGTTVSIVQGIRARRAEVREAYLRRETDALNHRLLSSVSLMELQRAEDLLTASDPAGGVAHLAAILTRDPNNRLAADRLLSALVHRSWALPSSPSLQHGARVTSASFSPDGLRLLSASWDQSARIWDTATGELLVTARHQAKIHAACFHPLGDRFATASADGTARLWSASDGTLLRTFAHPESDVMSVEFSPDSQRLVTTSGSGDAAHVWTVSDGTLMKSLRTDNDPVVRARFSPEGSHLATGTSGGRVTLWDLEETDSLTKSIHPFPLNHGAVNALNFSPDGQWLAAAFQGGVARIYNRLTGQLVEMPLVHRQGILHLVFSPDSQLVLTTSQDGQGRLWKTQSAYPKGEPLQHDGAVVHGEFSADGTQVVTSSMDNTARLWSVDTGSPLQQPLRHYEAVLRATLNPRGHQLATASADGTATIWRCGKQVLPALELPHQGAVTSVAFHPQHESLLTTSLDGTARLWHSQSGKPLSKPLRHPASLHCGKLSPDGRFLVTGSAAGLATVWDAENSMPIGKPMHHLGAILAVCFHPEGNHIATASADGTARVWDALTGVPTTPPIQHAAKVNFVCFSPDGKLLATASQDHSARVWNSQTGDPVTEPLEHGDHVKWAAFRNDSKAIATASTDNRSIIWNLPGGHREIPPLQHARIVEKIAFSPDGKRLLTGSMDLTARSWDAQTGESVMPPLRHHSPVSQVSYSKDGRRILTGSWDGSTRIWDAITGRPLSEWLKGDGFLAEACFDAQSNRIAMGNHDGRALVWHSPASPLPVPPWFPALAESVAGMRVGRQGSVELVSPEAVKDALQELHRRTAKGFYENLAQWLVSDPGQRSRSPF